MRLKKLRSIIKSFILRYSKNDSYAPPIHANLKGARIVGDPSLITIGKSVSFGGNVILYANAPISIGDHTMVALNVILHTSTHNYNNHPMWLERIDKPIKIGKHAWIGVGAIISPGIIIGDYAVVGAGSVVVSNVPNKAIIAGNPARIIKYRNIDIETLKSPTDDYPVGSFISKLGYIENYCKLK